MIVQHGWNYYIDLGDHILKYIISIDKLIIHKNKNEIDISVFEQGKPINLDDVYKQEIVKQIFGGENV